MSSWINGGWQSNNNESNISEIGRDSQQQYGFVVDDDDDDGMSLCQGDGDSRDDDSVLIHGEGITAQWRSEFENRPNSILLVMVHIKFICNDVMMESGCFQGVVVWFDGGYHIR